MSKADVAYLTSAILWLPRFLFLYLFDCLFICLFICSFVCLFVFNWNEPGTSPITPRLKRGEMWVNGRDARESGFFLACEDYGGRFDESFSRLRFFVLVGSPSSGLDVAVYVFDINQPSLPPPFYSVLVSASDFIALSTVFHSINSPDNSPLFHFLLLVLFLFYRSFRLYISL